MDNSLPEVNSGEPNFASMEGPESTNEGSSKKPLVVIVLVVIVLIVGLVVFLVKKPADQNNQVLPTPTPTETPTPTPDDPTADWLSYEDDNVPFEIKYPEEMKLISEENPDPELGLQIVRTMKRADIPTEETLGYDKATAEKDFPKLKAGNFGEIIDFPFEASKKVTKVGDLYVKDFLVLSRLEVCSVLFEHFFIFYVNDYQVIIKVILDSEVGISGSAKYFKTDTINCGGEKVWIDMDEFYRDLDGNAVSRSIEDWFDISNLMVATIKVQ